MAASPIGTNPSHALSAHTLCVKWTTPAEELLGVASLVHSLTCEGTAKPENVCLAVPNRNWALQAHRACLQMNVESVLCVPPALRDLHAREALAKLALLARPESDQAKAAWASFGHSDKEADELASRCRAMRGFSLAGALGLDAIDDFGQALLHVTGEEDASALERTIREQLARPTLPKHVSLVPIADYHALPESPDSDWVFLIGCVDGLVPGPAAFEAASQNEREQAAENDRTAFSAAMAKARKHAMISTFTKIEHETAQAAHLRITRQRREGSREYAVISPSLFLREAGDKRPGTIGGQALLRAWGLN